MEVKVLCKDCDYKKVGESKLIKFLDAPAIKVLEGFKEWLWCKHHEVWCDETDYCSWGLPEKQYREEECLGENSTRDYCSEFEREIK